MLTPATHFGYLSTAVTAFAELLEGADLGAPVPACPGWTLRDLAWHLGGVHRWAALAVREHRPGEMTQAGPPGRQQLAAWYRAGAQEVRAALREAGPEAPTWTFGPPPHRVAFWFRRQAHETTVHLWDARSALGAGDAEAGEGLDPTLSADGVDEVVHMFLPRQIRLGRCPEPVPPIALAAIDVPAGWTLGGQPGQEPVAVVRASARQLYLMLWGRVAAGVASVEGDAQAAATALALPLVP